MRKKNNSAARMLRFTRALLRQNHVVVAMVAMDGQQRRDAVMNWKSRRKVKVGELVMSGITDLAHPWTMYLAVFCKSPEMTYTKAVEIAPSGQYRPEQLTEVIRQHHGDLIDSCNPSHIIGTGWIASPCGESLSEYDADSVFCAM